MTASVCPQLYLRSTSCLIDDAESDSSARPQLASDHTLLSFIWLGRMVNPGSSTTQQASSSSTEPHQASTSEMTVDEKLQFLAQAATVRDVEGPWRTDEGMYCYPRHPHSYSCSLFRPLGPPSIARRVLLDLQLEHEKEGSLLFLL